VAVAREVRDNERGGGGGRRWQWGGVNAARALGGDVIRVLSPSPEGEGNDTSSAWVGAPANLDSVLRVSAKRPGRRVEVAEY